MAQETQGVVVNVSTENTRLFEIVGTILMIGAVGMGAYALGEYGLLDVAATGLTMFAFQLGRMMLTNGLIVLPSSTIGDGDFAETRGMLKTAFAEYQAWQARSPIWRLAGLALAYTIAFMVCRWAVTIALGVFTNVWIAGACAAAAGAVIIAPNLISDMVNKMKSTSTTAVKEQ